MPANMRGVKLLAVIREQGWVEQRDAQGRLLGVVGPGTLFPPYTRQEQREAFVRDQRPLMNPWFTYPAVQAMRKERMAQGTLRDHSRECTAPSCPGAGRDPDACCYLVDGKRVSRETYARRVGWEISPMNRRWYPDLV